LPEINEKFKATRVKLLSDIYEGTEGLKSVMEMILKEKKWLILGSTGKGPIVLHFY
jgi:hypothetical protein